MTSQRTRSRMIQRLRDQGIRDERVLDAMSRVPRHIFVDEALAGRAYEDTALPIGHQQTISQPYMVALMTEALLDGGGVRKVLEIGTGSGYQAAVLSTLVEQVYTVERIRPLHTQAQNRFTELRIRNVRSRYHRTALGWPEHAPYDAIIITAAAPEIPQEIMAQVAACGRVIAPVGIPHQSQRLYKFEKTPQKTQRTQLAHVRFVPLIR